ncbi:M16 family metallopeptidase [Massilibacteroides sp.]|uniref:M16 family metallopeptidase n=1 Tax=Massilibacteroides sp. TaxID=2034766 RepID=UPI0026085F37|nr:M16 family metallopeptidase [Massilibacteroides sp.]MDD4515918.1 insulinase family protein [Massilibacteroides sp.]
MICRTRNFIVAFIFAFLATSLFAQKKVKPLPLDPAIVCGQLDNGLTYYIRQNTQPEQRAEFYLVQKTGSLQEEDNQRGLAHMLEHMAFNGTVHFPGQGIDNYLESIGLKGGENLNAYTVFDETVFMIMNAPTSRDGIIDSCLLILRDISSDLLLEDEAIEKERAVIREEWRSGQDADARLRELQFPVLLAGSKYAERLPIGNIEVIESFKPEQLRDYYNKWYRPDLQAVIVVGDLDATYVKEKLTRLFGEIPAPETSVENIEAPIPDNEQPVISIAKDKEAPGYIVNLFYKHDRMPDSLYASAEGIKQDYLQTATSTLLNERLELLLYEANPPFVFAQSSDGDYLGTKTKAAWSVAAIAEEGKADSTLLTLAREVERVKRFGFTRSEYERVKVNVLKYYENLYLERESEENSAYAGTYISHFTTGGYLPGIEMEFDLINQLAEKISLEDINQHVKKVLGHKNVVITLTGPEKDDPGIYPDKASLLQLFNSVTTCKLDPYLEEDNMQPLLSEKPSPGEIVRVEADERFNAILITLNNGVKVVAKQTGFKEDEIVISGTSPGGSTLFDKKDLSNLKVLTDVVPLGGLGKHSSVDINRLLAGRNVSCSISLDENSESIGGYSSVSDLRTLFELIYLHFTAPRMDEATFSSYISRINAQLKNLDRNPMVAFGDSLTKALYGDRQEMMRIKETELRQLNYSRIMEMYGERFADASDFTFTIVGSFNMDSVRLFAKEYLATLPNLNRKEAGREGALVPYRKGRITNHFSKTMETPKTSTVHYFHGKSEYTLKNILAANMLTQLLDLVYMEKVRKDEGGSYGVAALARMYSFPKGRTSLQIYYDTDPQKAEQINSIILAELNRIAEEPISEENFSKVKENLKKTWQENQTSNIFWLSAIDNYYFNGFESTTSYLHTLEAMTKEDIRDFTKELLSQGNHIEVIMTP